jgi:hypothetical protein
MKAKRRYTAGVAHHVRYGHAASLTARLDTQRTDPLTRQSHPLIDSSPSHCPKCQGPLGIRCVLFSEGKSLEYHCPLCGKSLHITGVETGRRLGIADSEHWAPLMIGDSGGAI